MVADTRAAAVDATLTPLRRAVSCVTRAVLLGQGERQSGLPSLLTFAPTGDPVRLTGRRVLALQVKHYYVVEPAPCPRGGWQAATVGYAYRLLDAGAQEIVAYHWHRDGPSPIDFPHLHVRGGTEAVDLRKAHLPTGQVVLAALVWFTIAELGARPLRSDWRPLLTALVGEDGGRA